MMSMSRRIVTGVFGGRENFPISAPLQSTTSRASDKSMSASLLAAMTAACRFCSFVSFFIGFPLLTGCSSGRDQPNHFFALFTGEQCVNNKENRARAKFADGVVPFLILIVKNVSNRHSVWVIEDQGGGWEINAVARLYSFLCSSYSNRHPATQTQDTAVYIHMSIQRFGAIAGCGTFAVGSSVSTLASNFVGQHWPTRPSHAQRGVFYASLSSVFIVE